MTMLTDLRSILAAVWKQRHDEWYERISKERGWGAPPPPVCAHCRDTGWLLAPKPRPCLACDMARERVLVGCGFLPGEEPARFEAFDPARQASGNARKAASEALREAQAWAKGGERPFLFLAGPPGTGKTHLLTAAVLAARQRDKDAFYLPSTRFDQAIKNFEDPRFDPDFWVDELIAVEYLGIDDLGAGQKATEFTQSRWERLIDGRYRRQAYTFIVTNLEPERLKDAVGERVFSRLRDRRVGRVIALVGEDQRPKLGG